MIPLSRISEIASARGTQPAIVLEDSAINWTQFKNCTSQYVAALQSIACAQRLDSICFVSPNRIELIYLMAAASSLKIAVFGLDYTQSQEDLRALMLKAGADLVVVSSRALLEHGKEPALLTSGRPSIDLDEQLENSLKVSQFEPIEPDQIKLASRPYRAVGFTSGTSGLPKIVLRDKPFDARRFAFFTAKYGFSSTDRHLVTIPFYHAAGNGWARLFLNLGATLILSPPADPVAAARMLITEGATTSAMTPPIAISVCRALEEMNRPMLPGLLRFVLIGGKNFSAVDKAFCSRIMNNAVHEYYGTTETGVNTIADPDDILRRPDTVGRAFDGNELIVIGTDNRPMPIGKTGRIAVASYMNMARYCDGEPTAVSHDGDQYILTNDFGSLDEDGYLRLQNRDATVIAADLYNIENEIRQLPCIGDASVVPNGTSRSAGVTCGFVLHEKAKGTPEQVAARVRKILKSGAVKVTQLSKIDAIPYSPSGKVIGLQLREFVSRALPKKAGFKPGLMIGAVLLAGTATAWGGMFHIAKSALAEIDAFHVTLVRYGLAALIFLAMLLLREGVGALRVGRDFWRLWILGTLGFAGFSILAFLGLSSTKPEHGAIIMALMPVLTVIVLFFWMRSRVSSATLGCIALALTGVLMVVTNGDIGALLGGALWPNLTILLGALCWVIYTVGARSLPDYSVLRYTAISASLGAVSILIITQIGVFVGMLTPPTVAELITFRFELAYLVLIAGVAAVFSWNIGVGLLGPVNGVLFINLVPITALVFGYLKGHVFSEIELVGSGVTIAALILNNLNDRGMVSAMFARLAGQRTHSVAP